MRIGIHTSIAGSLENAATKAAELGANTFQIFSASPRMWKAKPISADAARRMRQTREQLELAPLVIHDNYLINLAAADAQVRQRSISAFRGELRRAIALGAEYLVAHPGSYKGQSVEQAVERFAKSLGTASAGVDTSGLTLLIENTAGSGAALGSRFEELTELRRQSEVLTDLEIGFCLDTAHCLAAGYDVATARGLRETVKQAAGELGIESVRVIHANDSKTPLGSRVDRHEHIGRGHIGAEAFRRILRHPKLRSKPFILETPVEADGDDRKNIETLKELCRRSPTTTN